MERNIFQDWFTDGPGLSTFTPKQAALLIVDMVYGCCHRDYGVGERLKKKRKEDIGDYFYNRVEKVCIPAISVLGNFFRDKKIQIIYLTFGPAHKMGSDLYPLGKMEEQRSASWGSYNFCTTDNKNGQIRREIAPIGEDLVINKLSSGAFSSSNLDATLRNMGITSLFFTGVCTNMCVESTARAAVDRGYNTIIVDDGCATFTQQGHDATTRIFTLIYGKVASSEVIINQYPWIEWGMDINYIL